MEDSFIKIDNFIAKHMSCPSETMSRIALHWKGDINVNFRLKLQYQQNSRGRMILVLVALASSEPNLETCYCSVRKALQSTSRSIEEIVIYSSSLSLWLLFDPSINLSINACVYSYNRTLIITKDSRSRRSILSGGIDNPTFCHATVLPMASPQLTYSNVLPCSSTSSGVSPTY